VFGLLTLVKYMRSKECPPFDIVAYIGGMSQHAVVVPYSVCIMYFIPHSTLAFVI